MYPVQRTLYIRKPGLQSANNIRIRRDSETEAIHHSREANVRFRQNINIGPHPRGNAFELPFTEIPDGPPSTGVDQSEHLLTDVGLGTLGYREVGHTSLKWGVNTAVVQ